MCSMKNIIFKALSILFLIGVAVSCDTSSINFKEKKLPTRAQSFLRNSFPENSIDTFYSSVDKFYTVKMDNGMEVYFNSKGEWIDVWFNKQVPTEAFLSSLPKPMLDYVASNYPDSRIKEIEKNNYFSRNFTYSVHLSKLKVRQLTFNQKGEVLISQLKVKNLPKTSASFIEKYFASDSVIYIEQNKNRSYHVLFESGAQVDFDRKGTWEELSSKKTGLPESIISMFPKQARETLAQEKAEQRIMRIERKSYGYRVRLGEPDEKYISFSRSGAIVEGDLFDN